MSGFIETIREAVASQLKVNVDGVEVNVSKYGVPKPPPVIFLSIAPTSGIEYEATMDGDTVPSIVRLMLRINPGTGGDFESAVMRLDTLLDRGSASTSVIGALMADPTLGGLVMDIQFAPLSDYVADHETATVFADLPIEITVGN